MHTVLTYVLIAAIPLLACNTPRHMTSQSTHTIAIRLTPGQDVLQALHNVVKLHNITAGWLSTCVGSLTAYNIRFANQPTGAAGTGHYEIVSLVGTLSINGSHIHISISDSTGHTIGGHLLAGCKVYTTAEIVLQYTTKYTFERKEDGTTPYKELQVIEHK